ncbi:MAG: ABC transporter ATP-binding protein [Bacilli bacterium]|jgi:putative ABC transport system ATP-binding protein|nr:ABC transporter ATP-binding protein [Bacilli bacterium]MCH4228468.1 ABC transporter ATP-binding protein [Bacilli bacterium]MCH4277598.1 ABC transporter ATP-binding protein [Bacilli bacterium]MCI2054937.1 ABC transporter ATP-binding protein [Bacilli bacterium]
MDQIIVNELSKIYNPGLDNEVRALDSVSFSLNPGEFVVILGASGAGKSTLLNILGGMDNATSGSYLVANKDVAKDNPKELQDFRRKDVGFVFQFYNLMPNLTALENVELAASVADSPLDSKEVLKNVGLEKRENNFPSQLSGGEQQRVAIARAIVKNPTLLLCDEPTGALDSHTGASIIKLLYDVAANYKKTVIIVTHNSKISQCAERLIRISDGKIVSNEVVENRKKPEEIAW